ncbi:multidrug resistance protein 1A-like isoform X3 [Acanthaster planci]|uniref:Multidrug resistance protein 1A-like isoform X3 n=1 Tax=Acanthaster planci TaxID=133434 RepID=A0A8B7XSV8_ACAPL|nr:multidrug resistance protein 1A-like isoform X3 [Acanthaster planci]
MCRTVILLSPSQYTELSQIMSTRTIEVKAADPQDMTAEEPQTWAANNAAPPSEPPPPYNSVEVDFATASNGKTAAAPLKMGKVAENGNSPKRKGSQEGEGKEKKEKKEEIKPVSIIRLYRFASALDILITLCAVGFSIAQGVSFPLLLLYFGDITDAFIGSGNLGGSLPANTTVPPGFYEDQFLNEIVRFCAIYAILGGAMMVVAYFSHSLWNTTASRQMFKIRQRFFAAILRQEIGWFDTHESGELNTRLSDDVQKIKDGIGDKVGQTLYLLTVFVAGLVLGFVKSWKLTLVILAISPLVILSAGIMTKVLQSFSQKELDSYAKAGAIAEEVLSSIRTVVAFGGQEKEVDRYSVRLSEAKNQGIKRNTAQAAGIGIVYLVMFGAYGLAFWYGTTLFLSAELEPGDILVVFFSVLFGAFSLGQAGPNIGNISQARGAAAAVWKIIDQVPSIDSSSEKGLKPDSLTGDISFESVHFFYPSRPEVKVLNGLDLEVKRGQTVALVGSSGCGKSTTIQLIQRFYDAAQGTVRIDGNDIKDLNVKWLRQHTGVVSQEPILFGCSIEENIRYGRMDVTMEEIMTAAKEANAHDFISALPQGYETLVGERGAQLSGGQKQRVAIARALVRNPKILLLDEATSALDTESEGTVQAALDKAQSGRTTVVIAHRLSTIRNADVICAFKDGLVVERGTHAELMALEGGVYQQLVYMQSRKEEKPEEGEKSEDDLDDDDKEEEEEIKKEKREKDVEGAALMDSARADTPGTPHARTSSFKGLKRMASTVSTHSKEGEEEEDEKEVLKAFSAGRIMKLNAPEWFYILVGSIAAGINGAVQPAFAVVFSRILEVYSLDKVTQLDEINRRTTLYCLLFAGLGIVTMAASLVQGAALGKSGEELTIRLRHMAFKAMLRQEIGWFDDKKNSTGALTTRLATEASQVQGATGARIGVMMQSICNIGVAIIIAFIYGWQLTLLVLAFLPFIAIAGAIEWQLVQSSSQQDKDALEISGKIATEAIENIRTVASLTREETFYKNYVSLLVGPHKTNMKRAQASGLAYGLSQGIIFFAYAAAFRLGGHLVLIGEMEFQNVFLVFSAIIFGGFALGGATALAPDYSKAKFACANMFRLMDREPLIDAYSTEGDTLDHYNPEVAFEDVRFRYPTRLDVPVLRGLTVSVKPGETLALVGSSGCGKSTSIQLLEKFYNPRSGTVLLDGHGLDTLNLQWLRAQIGLVSQEPVLFDRTIADNIAYGDNSREVPMTEVIEAAKKSNIHEFIASLPAGYETKVGEKGTQLSGGQKQRVAIARALVRNPKILLLDEATSALDTESEKVVQAALDEAKKGRTCITIAHRLSTIHDAEKIVVIRHGKVAEMGRHEDLMQLQGQYHSLYTKQDLQH